MGKIKLHIDISKKIELIQTAENNFDGIQICLLPRHLVQKKRTIIFEF